MKISKRGRAKNMSTTERKLPSGIILRTDGRYQGRITYNRKRYSVYGKDIETVQKKMTRLMDDLIDRELGPDTCFSLNRWFEIWLKDYKMGIVKNSTILLYNENYGRYVKNTIGEMQMRDIKTLHVQQLFNKMRADGLSIGTVQIVSRMLSNLFSYGIKNDLIPKNPCSGTIIPKGEKKTPRVLTRKEQQLFLNAIKGNFYEEICLLALGTGLRIGELTALRWKNIDFERHVVSVEQTLLYQKNYKTGKMQFLWQTPKSSTSKREIPILPEVEEILKNYKEKQRRYIRQNKWRWEPLKGMEDMLFTTRRGTPVQEGYVVRTLYDITDKMNEEEAAMAKNENRTPDIIENITPHTLRHTFATRAFENGMAPKTVQEILGHANLGITMDLYTHVTMDWKHEEMKKMTGIFGD